MEKNLNKKALNWLYTAHFANDTYSGFLNPIMPFIAMKIGISMAIATFVISIAQVCASLFQPIFGFFADNIYKRVFIFWGLLLGTIFVPLAANAPNVYILTLFIILGNLGGSFFHPQALGFVARFSEDKFALNMGIFVSAGTIGFSLGPIISSLIAEHLGFEKIPYLSIFGVLVALSMFKFVPKISDKIKIKKHIEFLQSFKNILTNKSMNILILVSIVKTLITNSAVILLPFLWKNMGYSPSYIGVALFLYLLAAGLGSFVSAGIESKIGAKIVFKISMIGTLPIMILFLLTYKNIPWLSLLFFMIMGFITMLAQPVMLVMAQRILPEYKSIVSGLINGFSWGIVAIFLTSIGFFAEKFGIVKVLFIVSFIPAICSYFVNYLPEE